jgi:hypothetical protein
MLASRETASDHGLVAACRKLALMKDRHAPDRLSAQTDAVRREGNKVHRKYCKSTSGVCVCVGGGGHLVL